MKPIASVKYIYSGDEVQAATLKGRGAALLNSVHTYNPDVAAINQTFKGKNGALINIDISEDSYNRNAVVRCHVPVGSVVEDDVSGFLYLPCDNAGNYLTGAKTGNYPQVNLIKTNTNGYVGISDDVTLDSTAIYWTNAQHLIANNYRKGKRFLGILPAGNYSWDNGKHYFSAKIINHAFADQSTEIRVYRYDKTLLQTFVIPNILNFRCFQTNKSANEFVIIGDLQSQYSAVPKALPFAFDFTSTTFSELFRVWWEGIARYSITETGVPATPYAFTLVSYKEQWRGCAMLGTGTTVVGVVTAGVITTTTTTQSYATAIHYNADVVMYAKYSGDVYSEILFKSTSVVGTIESAGTSAVDNALYTIDDILNYTYANDWKFSVNAVPCRYINNTVHYGRWKRTNDDAVDIIFESTHHYDSDIYFEQLNNFNPYSKITPICQIAHTQTIDLTGGDMTYTPFTRSYVGSAGTISFPVKNNSTANNTGLLPNDLLKAIDSSYAVNQIATGGNAGVFNLGNSINNDVLTVIDPLKFFTHKCAVIFTDKHNNHLAIWDDTANYANTGDFGNGKALVIDTTLVKLTDLATKLANPFYFGDFFGAV